MVRRITSSQARSKIRQTQAKQQQAINNYNRAARNFNSAVANYNREARAHYARVRTNKDRLRRELRRLQLSSQPRMIVTHRQSVITLHQAFTRLESRFDAGEWHMSADLFDLSEGEAANSVAVLNAMLEPVQERASTQADLELLRTTVITTELSVFDPDLNRRWRGALFALHPQNPDAARHFCTSAREMLSTMLEIAAPDSDVEAADPFCDRTPNGTVSRRARVRYCLRRGGNEDSTFEDFVEGDLHNVVSLFDEFNSATHGPAGAFPIQQLVVIKERVEGAIRFIHQIAR